MMLSAKTLAKRAGLSLPTIYNRKHELAEAGLVENIEGNSYFFKPEAVKYLKENPRRRRASHISPEQTALQILLENHGVETPEIFNFNGRWLWDTGAELKFLGKNFSTAADTVNRYFKNNKINS